MRMKALNRETKKNGKVFKPCRFLFGYINLFQQSVTD